MNRGRTGVVAALLVLAGVAGCGRTSNETPAARDTTSSTPPQPTATADGGIPLPFRDWGACPFECCTYREWTANAGVTLYADVESPTPVGVISPGDSVLGVTGVVITTQPGHASVLRPFVLGDRDTVTVLPSDSVYVLHNLGEGSSLMWVRGKTYPGPIEGERDAPFEVVDRPVTTWWVKVRPREGREGWTKQTTAFNHMDSCE